MLSKSNPWAALDCGRERCFTCMSAEKEKEKGRCNKEGMIYSITCITCRDSQEKRVEYLGETGRSLFQRGTEHLEAILEKDEQHPLVKHWIEEHLEDRIQPEVAMKAISSVCP